MLARYATAAHVTLNRQFLENIESIGDSSARGLLSDRSNGSQNNRCLCDGVKYIPSAHSTSYDIISEWLTAHACPPQRQHH
jgi:hypothetical protein